MSKTDFTDLPVHIIARITEGMSHKHLGQLSVMHSKLAATVRHHHSPKLFLWYGYDSERLAELLKEGANPNASCEEGVNVLAKTFVWVDLEGEDFRDPLRCAKLLLANGATPTEDALKILVRTCRREFVMQQCLDLLIHGVESTQKARLDPNHPTYLHELLCRGFYAAAADLVEAGVTKDTLDATMQLTVRTAERCRAHDVEFLLARGADPRAPGLVSAAVRTLSVGALQLLLEAGAPVEQELPGDDSTTPLAAAVARNSPECVKLLIEHGARVASSGSYKGFMPILSFVRSRGMLHLLRSHNAPLEGRVDMMSLAGQPPHGWTAMHVFAYRNRAHIIHEMIGMGGDVDASSGQPQTKTSPLELAVAAGAYESVMILLQAGADMGRGEKPLLLRASEALQRAKTPEEQNRCNQVLQALQDRILIV